MFNKIRKIKIQANQDILASQNAINGLNVKTKEFSEAQELAIRKAFIGLKASRHAMNAYGSNLIKRVILWIFCGRIVNKVNLAISEILPYRQSSRNLQVTKDDFEQVFQEMKANYKGDQRSQFEQKVDAVNREILKSVEICLAEMDDLADLMAMNQLNHELAKAKGKNLGVKVQSLLRNKWPQQLKNILREFNQEDRLHLPRL